MSSENFEYLQTVIPTPEALDTPKARVGARVAELMGDRHGELPVWIRSPKAGPEYFSGLSRAKLYELAGHGKIRSVSIRQPGQVKGTRLFHLQSILEFIEGAEATSQKGDKAG